MWVTDSPAESHETQAFIHMLYFVLTEMILLSSTINLRDA